MRFKILFLGALSVLWFSVSLSTPTHAQSFFQTLFGYSKPAPRRSTAPKKRTTILKYYGGPVGIKNQPYYNNRYPRYNQSNRQYHAYGSYRTVCVRACDGFYFPISSAISRGRFHKDARTCQNRCGTAAELYYLPRRSDNMKEARNLSGRSYSDLENAFKYRKKLVNGCACRPMPWSVTERSRHRRYEYVAAVERSYALAEARAKKRREEEAARIAQVQAEARKAQADRFVQLTQNIRSGTEPQNETVQQSEALVLASNTDDFQDRWLEASHRYATPYYIYVLRQHKNATKTLDNIASHSNAYQMISAQGTQSIERPGGQISRYTFGTNEYSRTRVLRNLNSRPLARSKKRRARRRKKKSKKSSIAFGGVFSQKKAKYRWPGD